MTTEDDLWNGTKAFVEMFFGDNLLGLLDGSYDNPKVNKLKSRVSSLLKQALAEYNEAQDTADRATLTYNELLEKFTNDTDLRNAIFNIIGSFSNFSSVRRSFENELKGLSDRPDPGEKDRAQARADSANRRVTELAQDQASIGEMANEKPFTKGTVPYEERVNAMYSKYFGE